MNNSPESKPYKIKNGNLCGVNAMERIIPEYLSLFPAPGKVKISMRFSEQVDRERKLPLFSCNWPEIASLFHPDTNEPFQEMFFDEWLYEIKRYEINPGKSSVTIVAGNQKTVGPEEIEAGNRWFDQVTK